MAQGIRLFLDGLGEHFSGDDIERTPFGANICGEAQDLSDTCVP